MSVKHRLFKKVRQHIAIIIALIIVSDIVLASWRNTGYITMTQPNGEIFIARSWGDEFEAWMETNDGYRIVRSFDDWYYYAILDASGEFTNSNHRVAIDTSLALSYQLERSTARKQEILTEIEEWNIALENTPRPWLQEPMPQEISLAVVLIDFTPSLRDSTANDGDGYYKTDFDNMFFSNNYYSSEEESPHPEGDAVFV